MLSDEGIDVFAPADLNLKINGNRVGKFKGWSDERALAFQKRAYAIINNHRRVAVASGIVTSDFNLKLAWLRKEDGLPRLYYTCALDVLANTGRWIRRYRIKEPIQYIFETGDDGYYEVERLFAEINKDARRRALYNLASYTRAEKKSTVQLQAAGVWAYESYKHVANQYVLDPGSSVRQSWKALFRDYDRQFNTFWDKESLQKLIETYKDMGGPVA